MGWVLIEGMRIRVRQDRMDGWMDGWEEKTPTYLPPCPRRINDLLTYFTYISRILERCMESSCSNNNLLYITEKSLSD